MKLIGPPLTAPDFIFVRGSSTQLAPAEARSG